MARVFFSLKKKTKISVFFFFFRRSSWVDNEFVVFVFTFWNNKNSNFFCFFVVSISSDSAPLALDDFVRTLEDNGLSVYRSSPNLSLLME